MKLWSAVLSERIKSCAASLVNCFARAAIKRNLRNQFGKWKQLLSSAINFLDKFICQLLRFDDHIIHGEQADVAEFPHMAALGYENEDDPKQFGFNCGGTLISAEYVVTAAHCVNMKGIEPIFVRLGKVRHWIETDHFKTNINCRHRCTTTKMVKLRKT